MARMQPNSTRASSSISLSIANLLVEEFVVAAVKLILVSQIVFGDICKIVFLFVEVEIQRVDDSRYVCHVDKSPYGS